MGSCVDNTRILEAATEVVAEGGLGEDLFQVPAVGVAPEWMSEKAIAIGHYFVASGVDVVLGHPFHIAGSENVKKFLNEEVRDMFGGCFHEIEDPMETVPRSTSMQLSNFNPQTRACRAAVVADNVRRLTLRDVEYRWPEKPAIAMHGLCLRNVSGLIENCPRLNASHEDTPRVLSL